MKIDCGDGYLRPMADRDLFRFSEAMADWPEDQEGSFTLARSIKVVAKHTLANRQVEFKLADPDTKFNLVMVWCGDDDVMRGYWRIKVTPGRNVHLGQTALHPEWRGKGKSRLLDASRNWMLMNVFTDPDGDGGDCTYDIMSETAPAMTHLDDRLGVKTKVKEETGVTRQIVTRHKITRKQYKDFLASSLADIDNAFVFSVVPANQA